jgi:superoxide dismutase, Fe-Mn family
MTNSNRREFLKTSLKGAAVTGISASAASELLQSCSSAKPIVSVPQQLKTPFTQQPLPYAYNALENVIDAQTMEIHYTKHAAAYSKNLIEAAKAEGAESKSLENILETISQFSVKMRNNGGGHYNHELFWKCMRPKQANNLPTGKLADAINTTFGSFASFKTAFSDAAKNRFGSGWAWLYISKRKQLLITSTPNQDNPLMDINATAQGYPILGLDVWEHAYYLKYQNKRADYIENWWNLVNWDYVDERYRLLIG